MNTQAFETAKAAYQRGDFAGAASALLSVKAPGEVCGEADHLRGNALMKLGSYAEAANAYGDALADAAYAHVGALNCNRGRALMAAGNDDAAISAFQAAVTDATYPTPYKAYTALGNLFSKRGLTAEAASAWRAAAIDESNPDPSTSLTKLGDSFMQLGRANDAVDAYRTALDFSTGSGVGNINALLGQAYMASNRVAEAADAFNHAIADPTCQLTAEQQASYTAAQRALSAAQGGAPSETDQFLSAAGYGNGAAQQGMVQSGGTGAYDPLDPMGRSGEFIPSPEDTGFFSVTEEDLMKADKANKKARRKHKHRGLKVFLVIVILLLVLGGGSAFAYYKGYGWPTQEAVVTDLFNAGANGSDISGYLASSVSDETKSEIEDIMPRGATTSVSGVDRSMSSAQALVTASLASGGTQDYTVSLVRDGLGWKVSDVKLTFASAEISNVSANSASTSASAQTTTDTTTTSTDATSTETTSTEATGTETSTEATGTEGTATEGESSEASAN